MTGPTTEPIDRFAAAEELEISTRRSDGGLRPFVPIWVVAVDGQLYVRSYRGPGGAWYRHALALPEGAIRAGAQHSDVTFTQVQADQTDLLDAIGEAYRTKYARYGDSYLKPMLADAAVAATLRLNVTH
jgi:hypothetical protein